MRPQQNLIFVLVRPCVRVLKCARAMPMRNPGMGEGLISDGSSESLAYGDRLDLVAEKLVFSKALPAVRIRAGAFQGQAVLTQGETTLFYLRSG
jgi:hypothetical protein